MAFLTTWVQHADEDDWKKTWTLSPLPQKHPWSSSYPVMRTRLTLSVGGLMPLLVSTRTYEATQVQLLAWDEDPFSHSPPNRKSTQGAPLKRS